MSFIGFFKTVSTDVHTFLVKVFGETAIENFEHQLKTILEQDVFVVFTDAVTAADSLMVGQDAATGAAKRSAAFSQIVTDLKGKGVSLGESVINLGIELAVNLLKSKTPTIA